MKSWKSISLQILVSIGLILCTLFFYETRTAQPLPAFESDRYERQWGLPIPFLVDYPGTTEAVLGKRTVYDSPLILNFFIDVIIAYFFIEGVKQSLIAVKKNIKK
jgi:hypothetical protein